MGQDTIENVSWPIKNLKCFFKVSHIFDTSKCATNYRDIFEVYDGFIDFEAMKAEKSAIWPKSSPNLNSCSIKISHRLLN